MSCDLLMFVSIRQPKTYSYIIILSMTVEKPREFHHSRVTNINTNIFEPNDTIIERAR